MENKKKFWGDKIPLHFWLIFTASPSGWLLKILVFCPFRSVTLINLLSHNKIMYSFWKEIALGLSVENELDKYDLKFEIENA